MNPRQDRKWNSLCQLRDAIVRDGDEKVLSFNGHTLETDQNIYQLAHRQLIVKTKERGRKGQPRRKSRSPRG